MKIYYSDTFELPLPENHRFPMSKYRLLRERIAAAAAFDDAKLLIPSAATDQQLLLVHDPEWMRKVVDGDLSDIEERRIGFPWSPQMVERSRRSVGASIAAGRAAMQQGIGVNLAGGTHHAFPDAGQGYCVFNDSLVAARVLQSEGLLGNVLFIDLDVHQGNGTAAVACDDTNLFSFSMHCEKNFPFRKTTSDLDISLPPGTGDDEYHTRLQEALNEIDSRFDADLVFYLAGADPFSGDRLGQLGLSKAGLQQRDEMVMRFCERQGWPVALAMAGGYAPNIDDIVDIHFATVCIAKEFFALKSAK